MITLLAKALYKNSGSNIPHCHLIRLAMQCSILLSSLHNLLAVIKTIKAKSFAWIKWINLPILFHQIYFCNEFTVYCRQSFPLYRNPDILYCFSNEFCYAYRNSVHGLVRRPVSVSIGLYLILKALFYILNTTCPE